MLAGTARAKSTTREVAARTLAGTARAESKTCDVVIRILAGTARAESTPHKKFLRFPNLIFGSISRPRNKVKSVAAGIRNYRTSTTNRGAKTRSMFPPKAPSVKNPGNGPPYSSTIAHVFVKQCLFFLALFLDLLLHAFEHCHHFSF